MTRKAWLVWRAGPRGLSAAVFFEALPGPDGRAYGPRIVATHELPAASIEALEAGSLTVADLAACYPAPKDPEA